MSDEARTEAMAQLRKIARHGQDELASCIRELVAGMTEVEAWDLGEVLEGDRRDPKMSPRAGDVLIDDAGWEGLVIVLWTDPDRESGSSAKGMIYSCGGAKTTRSIDGWREHDNIQRMRVTHLGGVQVASDAQALRKALDEAKAQGYEGLAMDTAYAERLPSSFRVDTNPDGISVLVATASLPPCGAATETTCEACADPEPPGGEFDRHFDPEA